MQLNINTKLQVLSPKDRQIQMQVICQKVVTMMKLGVIHIKSAKRLRVSKNRKCLV